ncbi:MAG: hypothetical protein R3B13_39970 [Polyangiaceae bacterium]
MVKGSRFLLGIAAAIALSLPAPAWADSASAEALFRAGRDAAKAGDWAAACKSFHESNRLDPAPGTQLNIADCEEKQGHIATAWTFYKQVAEQLAESDERRSFASGKITSLEPRLPYLQISLAPGAPAGTTVTRNGVELRSASLQIALPVDPGPQEIVVSAPGHEQARLSFDLKEAERRSEVVEPGPAIDQKMPPAGTVETKSEKSGKGTRTLGWVLGGIGAGGLAVGVVTGAFTLQKKSVVNQNCDADKRCNQDGIDAAESGKTFGTISGVSFAVGAALVATGAVLVLTSDDKERPVSSLQVGPMSATYRYAF